MIKVLGWTVLALKFVFAIALVAQIPPFNVENIRATVEEVR